MIFRKGELVEVTGSIDESTEKFIGKLGRVEKVGDLDNDVSPFIVSFFIDGEHETGTFSHLELRLANKAEDARRRQCYLNEARLHGMQRKIFF